MRRRLPRLPRISRPTFPPSPRVALALVFLTRGFIVGNWFPRIPGIVERLDIPGSVLGIIWFMLAFGGIVAFSVAAALMKRTGSARSIRFFAVPYPIILTLVTLAPNTWSFALGAISYGFVAGGVDVSSSVQGGVIERAIKRPIISGLYGFFSLGTLVGSFFSGLLAQWGVPIPLQFASLAVIAVPLFTYATTRLLPDETRQAPAGRARRRFRISLPPKALWPMGAMVLLVALGEESINNWVALYMRQDLGSDPAIAGFAYTSFAVATFAGRITGDAVILRFGVERVLMGGSLLAAIGIGFSVLVNAPWAFLIGFALVGAGLSIVVPVTYRRAGEIPGMSAATAVATVASIGYLGFLIGPILIGMLADLVSLRLAFGLIAIALLGIFALVRPDAKPEPLPAQMPDTTVEPPVENPLSL